MSFFDALRFPFRKEIASKVLKFVLAYAVISTILAFISDALGGSELIGYLFQYQPLVYVFLLSGYSIELMRKQQTEEKAFPNLQLKENLKTGLQIFLASLAYLIAAWLLY